MNEITFSEETINEMIEEFQLEMSFAKTKLEREYYKGVIAVYNCMLELMEIEY